MRNSPNITFGAKRCAGGFHPVADGDDPGGYFGGQRVFIRHILPHREMAREAAEALYWRRINENG